MINSHIGLYLLSSVSSLKEASPFVFVSYLPLPYLPAEKDISNYSPTPTVRVPGHTFAAQRRILLTAQSTGCEALSQLPAPIRSSVRAVQLLQFIDCCSSRPVCPLTHSFTARSLLLLAAPSHTRLSTAERERSTHLTRSSRSTVCYDSVYSYDPDCLSISRLQRNAQTDRYELS